MVAHVGAAPLGEVVTKQIFIFDVPRLREKCVGPYPQNLVLWAGVTVNPPGSHRFQITSKHDVLHAILKSQPEQMAKSEGRQCRIYDDTIKYFINSRDDRRHIANGKNMQGFINVGMVKTMNSNKKDDVYADAYDGIRAYSAIMGFKGFNMDLFPPD